MKISFIATVYNEQENIGKLLDSVLIQSKLPDEIVIVDGGSTDNTVGIISRFAKKFKLKKIMFRLTSKKGNRSVGRNEAITNSTGDIIICSDAGCILDRDWVKNIIKPFEDKRIDVVAGFYKGLSDNVFQKCLIPYVLVMPDKVNPNTFLPATRSMAFKKLAWEKAGGFPEQFSYNEDYVFAKKLKSYNAKIVFAQNAFVYWLPRKNIREAFVMFFRFAKGDAEAGILRSKVLLILLRYIIGVIILIWNIKVLLILLIVYIVWSIFKNYRYILDIRAVFILPSLQITSDIAVFMGTLNGTFKRYGI